MISERGRSEWTAFLHSPDEYLSNTHGLRHVLEVLRPARELNADVLDASQIYFLNVTRPDSKFLLGRFTHRAEKPLLQPKGWGSDVRNSFLNRFGSPLFRPE